MTMNVTVYDFTGIYENESFDFYKKEGARSLFNAGYVKLSDITGTNCICDDFAYEEIRKRISCGDGLRLSFFDNGNYHYMSKILMDELCENVRMACMSGSDATRTDRNNNVPHVNDGAEGDNKFDLIMFDHHPDMKRTSYGEVLSCGSWVLNALKDRKELNRVFIIGADSGLCREVMLDNPEIFPGGIENASEVGAKYESRVKFLSDVSEIDESSSGRAYISIDKDVLTKDELATNWDQGEMQISELEKSLRYLKSRYGSGILSVDVCGECLADSEDAFSEQGIQASNRVNSMIMDVFGNLA